MRNIPSLNGIRAISITIVILYHLLFYKQITLSGPLKYLGVILFNGPLGVNIFFIISGFLITTLLISEYEINQVINLKKFYVRRTIRIFPAYYSLLLIYFILQKMSLLKLDSIEWLSALTYTKQFFRSSHDEINHLWSLSVEETFYLIWPIVFIKCKNLNFIIYILCLLVVLSRIIFFGKINNTIGSTGDSLLIGCYLAINYKTVKSIALSYKYAFPLALSFFLFSILTYNYFYKLSLVSGDNFMINISLRLSYGLFGSIGIITNLLLAVIITLSINKINLWFKFLNSRAIDYIGKLSYSIYLWQQVFICNKYFSNFPIIIIFILITVASLASYYLIEKPFLRFKVLYEVNKY